MLKSGAGYSTQKKNFAPKVIFKDILLNTQIEA